MRRREVHYNLHIILYKNEPSFLTFSTDILWLSLCLFPCFACILTTLIRFLKNIVIISISDDGYYDIEGSFFSFTFYSFLIINVTLLAFFNSTSIMMFNILLVLVNISRGIRDSLAIIFILVEEIM